MAPSLAIYHKLLHSIVFSELGIEILLDLLASKYFKYTNICYFTYISLKKLTQRLDTKDISGFDLKQENIKKHSKPLETKDKHSELDISKKMKLKFTKAWFAFFRFSLPVDVYKEVLVVLHQVVIPRLSNPVQLCDFLTRSYNIGGVISMMALSSLFILMTQHGLEYPKFYEKTICTLISFYIYSETSFKVF